MMIEACKICDHDHANCKYECRCSELIEVGGDEPEKQISDQLKSLEGYINDIPLVIDPCRICKHHTELKYEEGCHECCWFYDSKFEAGGTK